MEAFKRRNHVTHACPFPSFPEPVPQPILVGECRNKSVSVKCETKQKPKDEAFTIELTQPNGKKIQKNATTLEWQGRNSGTFKCVVKNQVSEKWAEKAIKCPGEKSFLVTMSCECGGCLLSMGVDECSHKGKNKLLGLSSLAWESGEKLWRICFPDYMGQISRARMFSYSLEASSF